jgi:hypothetical protein
MNPDSVAAAAHQNGIRKGEPLIVMAECLLRYAEAYRKCYGIPLAEDGVLGAAFEDAYRAVGTLLDGCGAVEMEGHGPSFDGGTVSAVLHTARFVAGIEE